MKKILGVGSIQRKEERKRRKGKKILNFKNEEPTHCIKEIKNENGTIVGYVEYKDKSTVKVPIKDLKAPLLFGHDNEEYVANGMEEDMIRVENTSREIRSQIENIIINSELKPRIVNGKIISMNVCEGDD